MKLHKSWNNYLKWEFDKNYMKEIDIFLDKETKSGKIIYPERNKIFNAFNNFNFNELKVVIIWQDPYHWIWQAHWLSFSVQNWVKIPPSLKNIFKEINSDIWAKLPLSWDLTKWANQWVLLLNTILTVEWSMPASHSKIWWDKFTNKVIEVISTKHNWIIFLLWWAHAQLKKNLINTNKHYILEAPHPSPFSAYKWFFWCRHFSKTNDILKKIWKKEITW